MICAEFREIAALYALGALDAPERAAAEAHLAEATHEGCFEALRQAAAGMEALARSVPPVRPQAGTWAAIEQRVRPARRARFRERAAWAVAAAAVLWLVASVNTGRSSAGKLAAEKQHCLDELSSLRGEAEAQKAAIALLQSPATKVVALEPQQAGSGFAARALVDVAARRAMVLSSALAPRAGKDFELWILRGQTPVPAGLLRAGRSGAVLASIDPQLLAGGADALAVSVEPAGGSPSGLPTGDIVLVGALPKT